MNPWLQFTLAVLATWRITHLLVREDGPGDVLVRVRRRLGRGLLGKLMDCFYCLSLWIAAPAALWLTRQPLDWFVTTLALSGAACLLERLDREAVVIHPFNEVNESEIHHELLRTDPNEAAGSVARGAADQPAFPVR